MSATNHTGFLELPQFLPSDKGTWVGDLNCAFEKIDTGVSTNATGVTEAKQDAATADAKAVAAQSTADKAVSDAAIADQKAVAAQAEATLAHTTADSAITRLNGVDEVLAEGAAAFKALTNNLDGLTEQVRTLSYNHNNLLLYLNDRYSAETLTLTLINPGNYSLYQGFGCRADGVLNVSANVMSENGFGTSQPEQIFYVEAPNSDYDLVSPQSFLGFMFDADNSRPLDRLTTIEVEVTSTLVNSNVRYLFTIKPNGSTTFTGNATLYISCGIALAPKKIPLND